MSRQRYPRIHRRKWGNGNAQQCECCDQPAGGFVEVEVTYMRGEDELYWVCRRHHDMAENNLSRMMAHYHSKKSYVKSKGE